MTSLVLWRRLVALDVRNIARDRLLILALVLPILVALLLRGAVPALTVWLGSQFAFDFAPYLPVLAGGFFLVAPSLIGFVAGFLLLDERDDGVFDAIRVTPVSTNALLLYRVGMPLFVGTVMTTAAYPVTRLPPLPFVILIVAALLGACSAPILALGLAGVADNKVSGFAVAKAATAVSNLALVAWFIPAPWQWLAGFLPSFWPMKVVWQGADGADWRTYALVGLAVNATGIGLVLRLFRKAVLR